MQKTFQPKVSEVKRAWHQVDAQGQVLGRLSTRVAELLMGKHKVNYVPHLDMGDHVVVINAEKVVLTGAKEQKKLYWRHSGYPGGMRITPAERVRREHPERLLFHSIAGMLPKNKLRDRRLARLHIFGGETHPFRREIGG